MRLKNLSLQRGIHLTLSSLRYIQGNTNTAELYFWAYEGECCSKDFVLSILLLLEKKRVPLFNRNYFRSIHDRKKGCLVWIEDI